MIPILYGSQTGTSAHIARLLAAELDLFFSTSHPETTESISTFSKAFESPDKEFCHCFVLSIDRFDFTLANEFPMIVFIVATHGDGHCPFNMAKLWDLLAGEALPIFSFKYAVLGLGSSSFERYNWCGKILYERLGAFGATGLIRTLADSRDEKGAYGGYGLFVERLKSILSEHMSDYTMERERSLYLRKSSTLSVPTFQARLLERKLVTSPDYDQKVYELTFDIPDYADYYPGDCIGIMAENSPSLLQASDFSSSEIEYLKKNVDLMAPPRQTFISAIIPFCDSPIHAKRLSELANNYNEYFEYVCRPRRTPLEVLSDFKIKPTFTILKQLEPIYLRYYSVAKTNGTITGLSDIETKEAKADRLAKTTDSEAVHSRLRGMSVSDGHNREKKSGSVTTGDTHCSGKTTEKMSGKEVSGAVDRGRKGEYICDDDDSNSGKKPKGVYKILLRDIEYKTSLVEPRKGLCCEYLKNSIAIGSTIDLVFSQSRLFFDDSNLLFFSTGTGITLPRSVVHYFSGKRIRVYQGFRRYGKDQLCLGEFEGCEMFYAASVDDKSYVMDVYRKNPVDDIDNWVVFVSGNTRVNKEIRKLLLDVHGREVIFQSETW